MTERYLRTDVTPEEIFLAIGKLRMEARREINRLIQFLDKTDDYVSRELEDDGDLEQVGDAEPDLGSFDRVVNQEKAWSTIFRNPDVYGWPGVDAEQDESDYEDADPDEDKQQPPEMGGAA